MAATVDLVDVLDHPDLHRHDVELLAGFFADNVFGQPQAQVNSSVRT